MLIGKHRSLPIGGRWPGQCRVEAGQERALAMGVTRRGRLSNCMLRGLTIVGTAIACLDLPSGLPHTATRNRPLIQSKSKNRIPASDDHILLAIEHIGLRSIAGSDARLPQRRAVLRFVGNQVS